jgi:hypothetical protein
LFLPGAAKGRIVRLVRPESSPLLVRPASEQQRVAGGELRAPVLADVLVIKGKLPLLRVAGDAVELTNSPATFLMTFP